MTVTTKPISRYSNYTLQQLDTAIKRLDTEIYCLRPRASFNRSIDAKIDRMLVQLRAMIAERNKFMTG